MADSTVAEINESRPDSTGAIVRAVYAKVTPIYAVYATERRVMVHFADSATIGSEQRQALASLNATRGEIDGLVDCLREGGSAGKRANADRFDRRVADALVVALQGQHEDAAALLNALRQEICDERISLARIEYLMAACVAMLVLIGICAAAASSWLQRMVSFVHSPDSRTLWFAAGAGTVGAFFSIAIAIRNRSVRPGHIWRDNVADAALRILVGAISAVLLVSLMRSGMISLTVGNATLAEGARAPLLIMVIAFLAGFLERLVPDLLARSSLVDAQPAAGLTPAATAPPRGTRRRETASEMNPLGEESPPPRAAAAAEVEEGVDDAGEDCCGVQGDEPATEDVELPEALGGVAMPPPKG